MEQYMNELANENDELQQYIQNHLPPEQPELPEEGPEPNEESEGEAVSGLDYESPERRSPPRDVLSDRDSAESHPWS